MIVSVRGKPQMIVSHTMVSVSAPRMPNAGRRRMGVLPGAQ